jgi:uncharacterized membrane protein required for colicin V production
MEEEGILNSLNYVDIVVVVYLMMGALIGLKRGLSGELARLMGLGIAMVAGWLLYEPIGGHIAEFTRLSERGSHFSGFLVSFLAALLVMFLVRWGIRNLMEVVFKGPVERIGGLIAGLLRCFIISAAVIVVASLCPFDYFSRTFGEESQIGRFVTHNLVPAYQRLQEEKLEGKE